jgi:hypothetical protein
MNLKRNRLKEEIFRILEGVEEGNIPKGMGTVRFNVICKNNSEFVLNNVKEVLVTIINKTLKESTWPSDDEWYEILPNWFREKCSDELNEKDAEKWLDWWRSHSPEDQKKIELDMKWSLSNWIYWMHPDNREWYWWDATCIDNDTILVAIEVDSWPFPWGSLSWLFKASDAISIEPEEDL